MTMQAIRVGDKVSWQVMSGRRLFGLVHAVTPQGDYLVKERRTAFPFTLSAWKIHKECP